MAIKLKPIFLTIAFFLISSTFFSLSHGQNENDGAVTRLVKKNLAEVESAGNASLILAAKETYRKDPLNHFNYYTGGWNIADPHYLASVAYASVPLAAIAVVWFFLCGLFLFCACCCCCCCCRNKPYGYSRVAYALSVIFLILFTIEAIAGCAIMYVGEGNFQGSIKGATLYIVNQAINIVNKLLDVYHYLSSAKNISFIDQEFLPPDLLNQIDKVNSLINTTGNIPQIISTHFTDHLLEILNPVHIALIIITVILLLLAFLGFFFSILGIEPCVYILVVLGWIIITLTFLLSGIFLLFHNVVSDTCVAMDEWVQNPTANSSMRQLLPCFNRELSQGVLDASGEVTTGVDGLLNQYIVFVANNDTYPPEAQPLYFNQSGPLVPPVCDLTAQQVCSNGEVALSNATEEWKKYVCQVSEAGICTTVGRLTPDMYNQMSVAVNVSYGLQNAGSFLTGIVNCTLIRDTFKDISKDHCPGLRKYSRWVYTGLVTATGSVMFSMIFWILYARERRHRKYTKKINKGYVESPLVGGRKL